MPSNYHAQPYNVLRTKVPAPFFPSPCHLQEFRPSLFHANNSTIDSQPPGRVEAHSVNDRAVECYLSFQIRGAAGTSLPIERQAPFRLGFHTAHPPHLSGNVKV